MKSTLYSVTLFLIGMTVLTGCGGKEEATAIEVKTKLTEEQMTMVLRDIHIAEAMLQSHTNNHRDSMGSLFYDQIFKIHQVTEADFYESLDDYQKQPAQKELLYNRVIEALNERKIEFQRDAPAKNRSNNTPSGKPEPTEKPAAE